MAQFLFLAWACIPGGKAWLKPPMHLDFTYRKLSELINRFRKTQIKLLWIVRDMSSQNDPGEIRERRVLQRGTLCGSPHGCTTAILSCLLPVKCYTAIVDTHATLPAQE